MANHLALVTGGCSVELLGLWWKDVLTWRKDEIKFKKDTIACINSSKAKET